MMDGAFGLDLAFGLAWTRCLFQRGFVQVPEANVDPWCHCAHTRFSEQQLFLQTSTASGTRASIFLVPCRPKLAIPTAGPFPRGFEVAAVLFYRDASIRLIEWKFPWQPSGLPINGWIATEVFLLPHAVFDAGGRADLLPASAAA